MNLVQSKSLLAKLMATENLHIEQRNVSTASFDVENRILTVPILDNNVTSDQYDLFMGHEVGHALYTPLDGLKKAYDMKLSMSVMNVLEDSRIERKIKMKYPGIRQCFIRAYKELMENNFFETEGVDLNTLNFIDRVNLYCKAGIDTGITFSDEEKALLDEIESTITYDDVIEVCKKVSSHMEEYDEPASPAKPINVEISDEESDGPTQQIPVSKSDDSSKPSDQTTGKSTDGDGQRTPAKAENDGKGSPDEESKDTSKSGSSAGSGSKGSDSKKPLKTPVAETDIAWRKNEDRLFSKNSRPYIYGNIPNVDLSKVVLDHKYLWTKYKTDVTTKSINYGIKESSASNEKEFNKFREESKKVVSYLVKEFELKKNAEQMKRASVSKTGELNMSKIFSYKFSEDIFKRMTVMPNGKSHGLVMFIDWSGSMHRNIDNTIRQLLNLVMFCKKVNIPFEVYAFTSCYYENTSDHYNHVSISPVAGDMVFGGFHLMNLLSSRMSATEYKYAASSLLAYDDRFSVKPDWFGLSGTPLNEAVVAAMKIVPEFQQNNKLQIVNTVFLTDGDGNKTLAVHGKSGMDHVRGSILVIRDPITKQEVRIEETSARKITAAYIKLLKARTKSKVIGFYVMEGREFGYHTYSFFPQEARTPSKMEEIKKKFRSNKYAVVTSEGYDEYYLLRAEGLDIDDDAELDVNTNTTTRGFVSAFTKLNNNRKANRVVLNRFINLIA